MHSIVAERSTVVGQVVASVRQLGPGCGGQRYHRLGSWGTLMDQLQLGIGRPFGELVLGPTVDELGQTIAVEELEHSIVAGRSIDHGLAERSIGSILGLVCGEQRYHRVGSWGIEHERLQRGVDGLEERKMQLQRLPKL